MNDRFKFRCWNKLQNKMFYVINISWFYEKIKRIEAFEPGTKKIFIFDEYDQNIENTILMQCTGLKDKNGKLIYEGDIVKRYFICRSSIGDIVEENLFTVKFEDLKFGLFQIAILKGGTDYSPFLNFDEALELEEYAEEMEEITLEVIGNIYENPELLKECE